ncbi:MAG: hypothetical protein FJ275_10475, partial [Planctomycetes bacterium]|nr:hypothetical protein [Planctomycetota bacterium]
MSRSNAVLRGAGLAVVLAVALVQSGKAHAQERGAAPFLAEEVRSVAAARRMLAATVGLGSADGGLIEHGVASGVIVSPDGLILTVAHAMEGFDGDFAVLLSDGRVTRATALGHDRAT